MRLLVLTHDLSCAIGELERAARRCTRLVSSEPLSAVTDLAVAAVALTIQLAIDTTDRDPAEMRALESELIGKLKAAAP